MVQVTMDEDCKFLKDIEKNSIDHISLDLDNNFMGTNKGLYNLMIAIGQVTLFKQGIKPTRNWTLKSIKNYFGIKGSTQSILDQLNTLNEIIKEG